MEFVSMPALAPSNIVTDSVPDVQYDHGLEVAQTTVFPVRQTPCERVRLKPEVLSCRQLFCDVQDAVCLLLCYRAIHRVCGGLITGSLWIPKSIGAQVSYIKWPSVCTSPVHILPYTLNNL